MAGIGAFLGGGVQGGGSGGSGGEAPTGTAGGVLAGTYPNPTFAVDMATEAELVAAIATRAPLTTSVQTITYASSITVNASTGSIFRVLATGNLALADITGGTDAQLVELRVYASGVAVTLTLPVDGGTETRSISDGSWWTATFRKFGPAAAWLLHHEALLVGSGVASSGLGLAPLGTSPLGG